MQIATTNSYVPGTLTITNVSGHDINDLSNLEITFVYGGNLASGQIWGTPSINWVVARNGTFYTLTGGTTAATWKNGTAITLGFTAQAAAPANVYVATVIPPALISTGSAISQNNGTITVTNTTGAPIPLRTVEFTFTYAGSITNVWGLPLSSWQISNTSGQYVLTSGTQDATQLAPGATLTAGFTPVAGDAVTSIVFMAAIGAPATPFPGAIPTPTPTLPALSSPIPAPSPQGTCPAKPTAADDSCVAQRITMYGGQAPPAYVAFPQIHGGVTGGAGTYLDPITFAADPTFFVPGTTIYVPYLSRYFIMEDLCPGCSGATHVDLWMGGTVTTTALYNCANALSGNHAPIIVNPRYGYAVITTPLWDGQNCFVPAALPPPPFSPLGSP